MIRLDMTTIGIALIVIGAVLAIICLIIRRSSNDEELLDVSDALLDQIAEHRTYIVNQWISLLVFWFGVNPDDVQTKLTTPAPNQNTVYFFYENVIVYAYFNWTTNELAVETSLYEDEEGYTVDRGCFTISGKNLPAQELFKMIEKVRLVNKQCYDLTAEDVVGITQQIKGIARGFSSEDAASEHLFDNMADLMLLMRKKKNRNNRKLLKFYMGIMYWFWGEHGDEFLKYLEMDEQEEVVAEKQNTENTEGNE